MAMKEVQHGGDIYRFPVRLDFSVSVNPLGMPPESLRAAYEGLKLSGQYPDVRAEKLTEALSDHEGFPGDAIIPGNGAAELIYAITETLAPSSVLHIVPGFEEYRRAAEASGSRLLTVPLDERNGFALSEKDLIEKSRCSDLVFLCNPHNPTGYTVERLPGLLKEILSSGPEAPWVCVDECFLEFCENGERMSVKRLLALYPKLMVLRALTKFYGMPGLRVGYLLSENRDFRERVRMHLQPWNLSVPAQMAGAAAFLNKEYPVRTRTLIREEKWYLLNEMQSGLAEEIYGHEANFIFFRAKSSLSRELKKQGILIRSFEDPALIRGDGTSYYRIGIRTHDENEELIRAWREVYDSYL